MGPLDIEMQVDRLVVQCSLMKKLCRRHGFSGCVAAFPVSRWRRSYAYKFKVVKERCGVWGVRADIVPSGERIPLALVRKARQYVELLSVRATNRKVAAFAARDRRVDIVTLIPGVSPPLFRGDERYLDERGKLAEIRVSDIVVGGNRLETARRLYDARRLLSGRSIKEKVILSSGGNNAYSPRDPRDLVAFGHLFLDLDPAMLRTAMSNVLVGVVETNRAKLAGYHVVEGVWIEGKEEVSDNLEE